MGEVYRAEDTELGREVAIKVLPEAVTADPERLARFGREAKVLASLNHPNIAGVHQVEEVGGQRLLVMELVEGEDLAERLATGPIPLDETLAIAHQVALGLEAAHERGIVHRDLKPANIKVTPDGQAKILDFGLAKAREAADTSSDTSRSPTVTARMTGAGVILGTAAYMSPEQARGQKVDKRADVWAFGVVLYEMLTGQRAFAGSDVSEMLASVLAREPDWTRLPADLEPLLEALLLRCLHKDPKNRVPDIGTMRLALEGAFETAVPEVIAAAPRVRRSGIVVLAVGALLVAGLSGGAVWLATRTGPPPELRLDITTPLHEGQGVSIAVSPDGDRVVFQVTSEGQTQLWIRRLDEGFARPIPGTEGGYLPFWSPDGRSLGFFASGSLKRVDLAAASVRVLADAGSGRGGTWNRSGTILFAPTAVSSIFRIPAEGGTPTALTQVDPASQTDHRAPRFLPDGQHFLFYARGSQEGRGVYIGGLDGTPPKRLLDAGAAAVYSKTGHLLFARDETLLASRFDLERQSLVGEPFALVRDVNVERGLSIAALASGASGLIAYRAGSTDRGQLTWTDRSGKTVQAVGEIDVPMISPALGPDDRRLVVSLNVDGLWDLWLIDLERDMRTRLTSAPSIDYAPVWSPGGRRIAYSSIRDERPALYVRSLSAGEEPELLVESTGSAVTEGGYIATDWSEDGRFLLYAHDGDLWALPQKGEREPIRFTHSDFDESGGRFSPDGRWIAYESRESGQPEVFLSPFPGPGERTQVSTAGGTQARWRADGRELFYVAVDGFLMAAPVTLPSSGGPAEVGRAERLFDARLGGTAWPQYAVARDGRFLLNQNSGAASPISLILNWSGEP